MVSHSESIRRRVFSLALPAVLRMSLNMFVNIVDMIMIGSLGARAIGAVGIANQLFFFCIGAITAFGVGTTALVAQYVGAGDKRGAAEIARQSIVIAMMVTSVLTVLGILFAEQAIGAVLTFMENTDMGVVEIGAGYLRIISISIVFRFTMVVISASFQGAGDMKTPLYIVLVMNAINICGNALLIFGLGPFPRLGTTGAAIATAFSGIVAWVIAVAFLFSRRSPLPIKLAGRFVFRPAVIKKILAVGIPAAVEQITVHASNIIYTAFAASLGTVAIAANQILINAFQVTYLPGVGFAITATALVGQYLGGRRRDLAKKAGMETTRFAWFLTGIVGLIYLLFPRLVLSAFIDEMPVIEMAVTSLYMLAVLQPAIAIVQSLSGGLRGAGDTRWVMFVTVATMLVFRLILTVVFLQLGWGLFGIWLAMGLETALRAAMIYLRFGRVLWKVSILVETPSEGRI